VLNIFNWYSYSDYSVNFGANGVANPRPVSYNYVGNINGTPREMKLMIGAKF